MKTNVSETSLEAYHSLSVKHDLQPKERAVLSVFGGPADTYTRQQLADKACMPINVVCGRVNSLVAKKALCVRGSRVDPLTRKRQELLGFPVAEQGGAALNNRISIPKRVRFEVFKRDGFTCQYCGAHPPSVVLHVDHVHPVSQGGTNDIDNLVTACEACNQGKSDVLLSDIPQSLQEKAAQIVEKEEQIKGYQRVLADKRQRISDEADLVNDVYELLNPGYTLNESSLVSVRLFIEKLGVGTVMEAMQIAMTANHIKTTNRQFKYFCGICWNRIRESA
jgi:5-methylcytosine-specific restriction endonuclease McrA